MKIAAAQIELSMNPERNVERISHVLEESGKREIDIVCFPEAALTGYRPESFSNHDQDGIEGLLEQLHERVRKTGTSAIIGTPYRQGDKMYNSVSVLLVDGRRLLYHKRYLVGFEHELCAFGTDTLVFSLNGLKLSPIICRDQNFPALSAEIKAQGADVIFISSAHYYKPVEARWKLDKNIAFPIVRATENNLYVCKANAVGTTPGTINLGHSLIVGPNGVILARAGEGHEQLLSYEIDPETRDWAW